MYVKTGEVTKKGLDSVAGCIQRAHFPLADFGKVADYLANLKDPQYYSARKVPPEVDERVSNLKQLLNALAGFRLPVYVLPATVGLDEVCEIFEFLNTTGTRVSVFDIIHVKHYPAGFDLRSWYQDCAASMVYPFLRGWCSDTQRPQWLNQAVTATWIGTKANKDLTGSRKVQSYKAGDLIATPLDAYLAAKTNEEQIDSALGRFATLAGGVFRLQVCPYPILAANYLALASMLKAGEELEKVPISEMETLFRAYYWRVVLNERYNQGFLTSAVQDLDSLVEALLVSPGKLATDRAAWSATANSFLTKRISQVLTAKGLRDILQDTELAGALRLGFRGILCYNDPKDLKSGNRLSGAADVELHHVFPKGWIRDNIKSGSLKEKAETPANLIPLSAESNNEWKAKSPSVALGEWKRDTWALARQVATSVCIDERAFGALRANKFEAFVRIRTADLLAILQGVQLVGS